MLAPQAKAKRSEARANRQTKLYETWQHLMRGVLYSVRDDSEFWRAGNARLSCFRYAPSSAKVVRKSTDCPDIGDRPIQSGSPMTAILATRV